MDIYNKLEREKRLNLWKIFLPLAIVAIAGYFLYLLVNGRFFIGWEMYFAAGCYVIILAALLITDLNIIKWMYYKIYFDNNIVKIKDGIFNRVISIPSDRIYYISSLQKGNLDYDSIMIIDKKINHNKIRKLSEEDFNGEYDRIALVKELEESYPGKTFYYYQVRHCGYKFFYYFFLLYRNCERCKFSDTSMELVKGYAMQS